MKTTAQSFSKLKTQIEQMNASFLNQEEKLLSLDTDKRSNTTDLFTSHGHVLYVLSPNSMQKVYYLLQDEEGDHVEDSSNEMEDIHDLFDDCHVRFRD